MVFFLGISVFNEWDTFYTVVVLTKFVYFELGVYGYFRNLISNEGGSCKDLLGAAFVIGFFYYVVY